MPRIAVAGGFGAKTIFMIVIVAIMLVFLWGKFTTEGMGICTQEDITKERFDCTKVGQEYDKINFVVPEQDVLESSSLWIVKLMIISIIVFLSYSIVIRFIGRNPSRRDMATLVVVAVGVYFLWTQIIEPSGLFRATSFGQLTLDNIGQKTAQLIGVK